MSSFWIYTGVLLGIIVILAWPVQQVEQTSGTINPGNRTATG